MTPSTKGPLAPRRDRSSPSVKQDRSAVMSVDCGHPERRAALPEDDRDDLLRKAAARQRRVRAARATSLHKEYVSHPIAQRVMTFMEFRNPKKRRRILGQFGR